MEIAEEVDNLGVVAEEEGEEAIGVAGDGGSEFVDPMELGAHLDDEGAIRFPGGKAVAVGAEQVGEDEGGVIVVAGATGRVAAARAIDDAGGDDEDLEALGAEEIHEERVVGLNGDQAVVRRDAKWGEVVEELGETLERMGELEAQEDGPLRVEHTDIVMILTPINTNQE